jgi:hypothetical protein
MAMRPKVLGSNMTYQIQDTHVWHGRETEVAFGLLDPSCLGLTRLLDLTRER